MFAGENFRMGETSRYMPVPRAVREEIKQRLNMYLSDAQIKANVIRKELGHAYQVIVRMSDSGENVSVIAEAIDDTHITYSVIDGKTMKRDVPFEQFLSVIKERANLQTVR